MDKRFTTTHWSLVQMAGECANPESRDALSRLCEAYWAPVYAYVRVRGNDPETARDLTQGFFAELLEKKRVKAADPERGRFRSFMLASVKNYMGHERARATMHRLRRRFGVLLREEVSETLADPALLDDELSFLSSALS